MPESSNELVRVRKEKLDRLKAKGVEPYPHRYDRTHTNTEAIYYFQSLETNSDVNMRSDSVSLAGRIMGMRTMGKATFVDLKDGSGRIQALFRNNILAETYGMLTDLDVGDWIGVNGPMFRTRTNQITLEVSDFTLLSKSLRPLPEKWHGLTNVELRYRQRYLDLISNDDAYNLAVMRSRVVSKMRQFMDNEGFMEVETPVLVPVPAGATATPFVTHHDQLDRDLYLRVATELYLKRLIIGGLEKVYEIGRVFRNEGVDFYHNPEFTMMESYEAYADYTDVMKMVESMVSGLAQQITGSMIVQFDGRKLDLTPPWPRLDLRTLILKHSGIDFLEHSEISSLRTAMEAIEIDVARQVSWGGMMDKLISSKVEPNLQQPSFLVDYPVDMSPLAKRKNNDSRLVERFEGFIAGMEICNAFSELNDPIDQRRRFEEQELLRAKFQDEETDRLDSDFLVAIEHGMPPTGGLGIGVDRLVMILSGQQTIREVILFPQLRNS